MNHFDLDRILSKIALPSTKQAEHSTNVARPSGKESQSVTSSPIKTESPTSSRPVDSTQPSHATPLPIKQPGAELIPSQPLMGHMPSYNPMQSLSIPGITNLNPQSLSLFGKTASVREKVARHFKQALDPGTAEMLKHMAIGGGIGAGAGGLYGLATGKKKHDLLDSMMLGGAMGGVGGLGYHAFGNQPVQQGPPPSTSSAARDVGQGVVRGARNLGKTLDQATTDAAEGFAQEYTGGDPQKAEELANAMTPSKWPEAEALKGLSGTVNPTVIPAPSEVAGSSDPLHVKTTLSTQPIPYGKPSIYHDAAKSLGITDHVAKPIANAHNTLNNKGDEWLQRLLTPLLGKTPNPQGPGTGGGVVGGLLPTTMPGDVPSRGNFFRNQK